MNKVIPEGFIPKRKLFIDLIRVMSCLYIIAYWHVRDYVDYKSTDISWLHANLSNTLLVHLCLGSFSFVSAYFISRKETFDSTGHLISYLKKRFVRIYPLYFLAIVSFGIMQLEEGRLLIEGLFLISMFSEPVPKTLWFITMIIVLNILSPLMLTSKGGLLRISGLGLLLWLIFLIYAFLGGPLDLRMLVYTPSFILGLMVGRDERTMTRPKIVLSTLLIFVASLFLLPTASDDSLPGVLFWMPATTAGCLLIFEGCRRIESWLQGLAKPIIFLSYSSFCMYLFHRLVMEVVEGWLLPEEPVAQFLYMFAVGVPLTIALAWFIQFAYDRAIAALQRRSTAI